jgi:C4-dicarboxylate transporter, DctQ subunit
MKRLLHVWDRLEVLLGGVLAILATATVVYGTLSRYLLHEQPSWTLEIVVYLIVWASVIMASHLMKEGGHVGADFVTTHLPQAVRRGVDVLTSLLALAFCLLVIWLGVAYAYDAYDFGEVSATSVRFPMWIAYAAVPSGALLLSLRLVQRLVMLIRNPDSVPGMGGANAL